MNRQSLEAGRLAVTFADGQITGPDNAALAHDGGKKRPLQVAFSHRLLVRLLEFYILPQFL